jgi:hypothetical protein
MTRVAGLCGLFFGVALTACTSGDDPNTNPNPNGRTCTATLAISGSFTPDATIPMPAGYNGCWPEGTWTFSASVVNSDCKDAPALQNQYQFKADAELDMNGDPIVDKFTLMMPAPTAFQNIVKVSELGNAICEGEVDLYSTDGMTVWSFRPDLQQAVNTNITGQGEYGVFTTNQWPF